MSGGDSNPFELGTIDKDPTVLQPAPHIGDSSSSVSLGANTNANPFATPSGSEISAAADAEAQNNDTTKKVDEGPSAGGKRSNDAVRNDQGPIPGQTGKLVGGLLTRAAQWPENPAPDEEAAVRLLTFWRNGFQFKDGELRLYSDPTQARILEEINAGFAPPSILNVRTGQSVEFRVQKRIDEDYVPPKGVLPPTGTKSPTVTKQQGTTPPKETKPPAKRGSGSRRPKESKWTVRSMLQCTGCWC